MERVNKLSYFTYASVLLNLFQHLYCKKTNKIEQQKLWNEVAAFTY
jgi:hypothetical protein